jgi:hypothetical protein
VTDLTSTATMFLAGFLGGMAGVLWVIGGLWMSEWWQQRKTAGEVQNRFQTWRGL